MRWLHARGDLSSPNSNHQCAARTFIRSEHQPKCLLHSLNLACDHPCRWRRADVLPIIEIGAKIKLALAASQCPTSRDFVPWLFLDAGLLAFACDISDPYFGGSRPAELAQSSK
jgi:hypothetical protein